MEGRVRVMSGKECRGLVVPAGCPAPLIASPPPLPGSGSAVTSPSARAGRARRPRGMKLEEWTRGMGSNKWLEERCALCSVTPAFTKSVQCALGRDAGQMLPLCRRSHPWLIINASSLPRNYANLGG